MAADAGTKADEHYKRHMAPWRFHARQYLLQYVRPESAVLAQIQHKYRRPWLDQYFAITANIGAHTFYLVFLPALFWFINYSLGLSYVLVLALGVFITGVVKDLLCLPRPASPPCHRISMSPSAMLEYGMPSTHSSNAVGVSLLVLECNPSSTIAKYTVGWLLLTLVLGRLYTSMHGFIDVFVGILLGFVSHFMRKIMEALFTPEKFLDNLIVTLLAIGSISACPQPVDDCPCFDDSVAFIGVVLGAIWTRCLCYVPTSIVYSAPDERITTPFTKFITACMPSFAQRYVNMPTEQVSGMQAVYKGIARYVVGVVLIVIWRHFSKRFLLRVLVPLWRLFSKYGLRNPRRFFNEADQYQSQPPDFPLDRLPDSKKEVKELFRSIKHTSLHDRVGPQSESDLYELQALNEQQNRELPDLSKYIEHSDIPKPRSHFDVEIAARLLVYAGIAPVSLGLAHILFNILHI